MKRKITLLLLAAGSMFKMNSQVVLSEDFTEPFNIGANGWLVVDNTVPLAATSWTQGNQTGGNNGTVAFNGNTDDFYMADFTAVNSTTQPGDISAFLITPTVTIYNGAVLQFATRTLSFTPPNIFPDRLQVLMSQTGVTTIPTGTANVGSFTNQLLDINPNLTTNNASAVSNGSVNGYPFNWTVYNIPVTGVTGTVTGRFAFRYFVTNGGQAGANSRLVALDAVRYTLPCGISVPSYTTCVGSTATLTALGGLSSTTYSWNTSSTSSAIVVSPTTTTVYSLTPSAGTVACGNVLTTTVTIGSQLSMNITASSSTVCPGRTLTLTANSTAQSYAWTNGTTILGTASTLAVSPTVSTTYSVGGLNGACQGGNTILVSTFPNPTVSITSASTLLCVSGPSVGVGFTGNGASSYLWVVGASTGAGSTVTLTIPAQTPTTPAVQNVTLGLIGTDVNGCQDTDIFNLTVAKKPTITPIPGNTFVCVNNQVSIDASGADTYTWTGATTATGSPITYSSSTQGNKVFTIRGTEAVTGCTTQAVVTISVSLCTGIEKIGGDGFEASVFPNPFVNELKLSGLEGTIEIYNAIGQVVVRTVASQEEVINTAELPKGAYILKAYNKEGETVKTIKLLKN